MSTAPLLTLILAVIFLGERPGAGVLLGTGMVVLGVILVSYEPTAKGSFHRGIYWGFASALSLGLSMFIRKKGIVAFPNPMLTVAWANLVGIPILASLRAVVPPELFRWGGRTTVIAIILLGVLNAGNQVFINMAVKMGDVSVVTPIVASSPIFSLLFTAVLLRDIERIRPPMVGGVLLSVSGMVLVAVER
jgi:DME family drug/metabolite transporter